MGKLRSLKNNSLSNSKKKKSEDENDLNNEENNFLVNDKNEDNEVKKMGLVKKMQFKKSKKENKLPLAKVFFCLKNKFEKTIIFSIH